MVYTKTKHTGTSTKFVHVKTSGTHDPTPEMGLDPSDRRTIMVLRVPIKHEESVLTLPGPYF